ncbi:MAG: transcription antitermination protein NusB [Alphaproteobacteria bacterium]|nr:transcription antitermination protein NusB [Alphaproteobacteria bacterium]MCB9975476.1 transcription antitermination protein NusB [Rhodospirillales bacterium]
MQKTDAQKPSKIASSNRKKMCARLMAVQAVYEAVHNGEPFENVLRDYLDNRVGMEIAGQKIGEPDRELFLSVARTVQSRRTEIGRLIEANIPAKQSSQDQPRKEVEPLLNAVLLCGIGELLQHSDIDAPLVINDYIEVTRAFYEKGEVSLVNGVLDSVARILRP